jgi:CHAT domain-containing protein/tetratricopeptide (TPR) repeat protein
LAIWRVWIKRGLCTLLACLTFGAGPKAFADEALSKAELAEVITNLEVLLTISGNFAEVEENARAVYGLVLRDFGAETAQAIEVERIIVMAAVLQGRSEEAADLAEQMMQKAIRVLPADAGLAYRAAAVYGLALQISGRGEDALGFLSEAVSEAEQWLAPDDLALNELHLILANVAVKESDFATANAVYQRLSDRLAGNEAPQAKALRAMALLGWADLAQTMGDNEAAVAILPDAIAALDAQFATVKHPRMVPLRLKSVSKLAEALILLDRHAEVAGLVRPLMAEVIQIYGVDSPFWAELAFPLAISIAGKDKAGPQAAEAKALLADVVAIWQTVYSAETIDLLRARLNFAIISAATGDLAQALAQIEAMGGRSLPGSRAQIVYVLHEAEVAGKMDAAQAVDIVLRLLQESQSSGAGAAQRLLSQRLASGSDEVAALLRRRTDAEGQVQSAQAQLAGLVSLPKDQRDAADVAALRATILAQRDEVVRLNRLISAAAPGFTPSGGLDPLSLAEIRRRLGPDAALVLIDAPQDDRDAGLIVAVSATAVEWHTFQVPASEVASAIAILRQGIDLRLGLRGAVALDGAAPPVASFDLAAAHWLYRQLVGQVEAVTAGKDLLYFDLRGAVAALPPQLMLHRPAVSPDPQAADWLIRHHAVAILPAIASLPVGRPGVSAGHDFLAYGDAVFASAPAGQTALRGSLAPLPETAREVRDVARAFGAGEAQVRLGEAASEAGLKAADLMPVGTLYFATHGLVSGDLVGEGEMAEPALALSAGGGEDGFLTATEIAGLKLNAGLVVMSACNTAAGDVAGGEALSGLAQSFLYAGARGLLVSHWPVESRSAVALMTDLFAIHAREPAGHLAMAQQTAILNMIAQPANPAWAHPAYWAPFVVVGNPE